LVSCSGDKNQSTSHAHILEEVDELDRIERRARHLPERMGREGSWYQEEQQCNGRYTGVDSQYQSTTRDELQGSGSHNQCRNNANWNTVRGHFVLRKSLANDVKTVQKKND
jgi:hypothetical protein